MSEEAKAHLEKCEECLDQIRSYRELEVADFTDATSGVDIANYIRVPAGQKLYLVVYDRGETPVLEQMELKSIEIDGAITRTVKSIAKVDPERYRAKEAVAVTSMISP